MHTVLTHSYLIDHIDPPECTICHHILSVEQILTEFIMKFIRHKVRICPIIKKSRQQYYVRTTLHFTKNDNLYDKCCKFHKYEKLIQKQC